MSGARDSTTDEGRAALNASTATANAESRLRPCAQRSPCFGSLGAHFRLTGPKPRGVVLPLGPGSQSVSDGVCRRLRALIAGGRAPTAAPVLETGVSPGGSVLKE